MQLLKSGKAYFLPFAVMNIKLEHTTSLRDKTELGSRKLNSPVTSFIVSRGDSASDLSSAKYNPITFIFYLCPSEF